MIAHQAVRTPRRCDDFDQSLFVSTVRYVDFLQSVGLVTDDSCNLPGRSHIHDPRFVS